MGAGSTPKYGIEYPIATDSTNIPGDMQTAMDDIDNLIVAIYEGTLAALPSPGSTPAPSFYFVNATDATNYGKLFFNTGSAWIAVGVVNSTGNTSIGGATLLSANTPGHTATEGDSGLTADAKHVHPMAGWGGDSNIQPLGAAASGGSSGLFADAAHVHPGQQVGDVIWSFAPNPDANCVLANGQALPYATYPTLYALATAQSWPQFSPPSGYFNVIDLRGQGPIGAGGAYAVGKFYGSLSVTLDQAHIPGHYHGLSTAYVTMDAHSHDFPTTDFYTTDGPGTAYFVEGQAGTPQYNFKIVANPVTSGPNSQGSHLGITGSTDSAGGNQSFSILSPSVGLYPYIRAL